MVVDYFKFIRVNGRLVKQNLTEEELVELKNNNYKNCTIIGSVEQIENLKSMFKED